MAAPNTNYSEIITTAIESRTRRLADNVTANNALLTRLKSKGKVKPFSGGHKIIQELDYAENSTYKRYSGYETLDISPSEVISAAEFAIKQSAVAVSMSGLEMLQNAGKEKMIDLMEARLQNAERTFANSLSEDVYSDGTGSSSKQIGGLQHIVADSPSSGTVGNINRATYSWWRNISYDATTDGGAAATSSNIQGYMNATWVQVVRGSDKPDLIVADNNYWTLYLESLQAIQRIGQSDVAEAGFQTLKYMNADVVLDGGYGGDAPTNHMYFLNCDYIFLRPHRDS